LYPISLILYFWSSELGFGDIGVNKSCSNDALQVLESISNVGYTLGFWLIFRGAIQAWHILLQDWWYGENRMAEYLDKTYEATETQLKASDLDLEKFTTAAGCPSAVRKSETRDSINSESPMHNPNHPVIITIKTGPSETQSRMPTHSSNELGTSIVEVELKSVSKKSVGGASPPNLTE
jgi:hypothetical protein